MIQPGIQDLSKEIGATGCYALCILKIAERLTKRQLNVYDEIAVAIQQGFIYNTPEDGMFVARPGDWIRHLTGRGCIVTKTNTQPLAGSLVVEVWKNAHFRLPDWDPLRSSQSVKTGSITSWRVFDVGEE